MTFAITQYQWADAVGTARPIYFGNDGTANAAVHLFTNPAGQLINPATQSTVKTITGTTITRPANTTAYGGITGNGSGFIIGASTSTGGQLTTAFANACNPVSGGGAGSGTIYNSMIFRTDTAFVSGNNFRMRFFTAAPSLPTEVDGSTYLPRLANASILVPGYMDHSLYDFGFDCQIANGTSATGPIPYYIASGSTLYGLIEIRNNGGWTPAASEIFTPIITIAVD